MLLTELEGSGNHQPAGHESPSCCHEDKGEDSTDWKEKCNNPDQDVENALCEEEPPPLMLLGRSDSRDDAKDPIDQQVSGEEDGQGDQHRAGSDEGNEPKEDRKSVV